MGSPARVKSQQRAVHSTGRWFGSSTVSHSLSSIVLPHRKILVILKTQNESHSCGYVVCCPVMGGSKLFCQVILDLKIHLSFDCQLNIPLSQGASQ